MAIHEQRPSSRIERLSGIILSKLQQTVLKALNTLLIIPFIGQMCVILHIHGMDHMDGS